MNLCFVDGTNIISLVFGEKFDIMLKLQGYLGHLSIHFTRKNRLEFHTEKVGVLGG